MLPVRAMNAVKDKANHCSFAEFIEGKAEILDGGRCVD
jgi:hypothetical protein